MSLLGCGSELPGGQVDKSEIVVIGLITRVDQGEFGLRGCAPTMGPYDRVRCRRPYLGGLNPGHIPG